ncbi:ArfGap-domain-containing protein [Lepidopterella palustris CBS 459.81]|uniref:ArfGap-domain-containing protein n=1 Tax=Lepidopterella palustris CBS 459.81 TaxID=1314670 RepID=A0A8E2EFJ1_9PEZI|nr:ArfGap-domain-containing protein [Lepidopterella palustris CBS 459.81]
MTSALNKRQQARNERILQELIKTVPGNDRCADCGARNPGWASWSLGIFLCMRCAALHRKLGTHISKVKSLSMDSWNNEQVDNMKRMGNTESNRHFNARNVKAQIPIDIDEVDGAMERYIRQKYEHKAFTVDSRPGTRQNTGSTSSVEDRPPPLPPKPGKRFGFGLRAASSTFPVSKNVTPPVSPSFGGFSQEPSPPRVNKASRVFGSNVGGSGDGLDSKLTILKEMGFPDEKRNLAVLKGLSGNLDRTVEALIRLGEGNAATARGSTPTPPNKSDINGITIERRETAPITQSNNPFEQLDNETPRQQPPQAAPLLRTQQMPPNASSFSHPASPSNPYNPFLPSSQQASIPQQGLEQSFQSLQLSQQQQPQQQLFPNRTGGYNNQGQQLQQTNPFQHSFTPPPVPQLPQQYNAIFSQQSSYSQAQQFQPSLPSNVGANPFLRSSQSQVFTQSNPFDQHQQQDNSMPVTQSYQPQQAQPAYSNLHSQSNPFQQQQAQMQQMSQQPQQQAQMQQIPQRPQQQNQQQSIPFQQAQMQQMQQQPQQPQQSQQQTVPFQQAQTQQMPQQPQQQIQQQQMPFQQQQQQSQSSQPSYNQSYAQQFQPSNPYQQQPSQFQAQPQQQQHTPYDKTSILALYNYPHLAPARSDTAPLAPSGSLEPPTQGIKQRSVTMPITSTNSANGPAAGSMNPFASMQGQGQALNNAPRQMAGAVGGGNGVRHVSNESVDFAGLMGGRHSPDAFSGLSARFVR